MFLITVLYGCVGFASQLGQDLKLLNYCSKAAFSIAVILSTVLCKCFISLNLFVHIPYLMFLHHLTGS